MNGFSRNGNSARTSVPVRRGISTFPPPPPRNTPSQVSMTIRSVSSPVGAAAGADGEVAFFVEAAAVVSEGEVVPDIRESVFSDVSADDVEAGRYVAVRQDVRIQPRARSGLAVDEGLR